MPLWFAGNMIWTMFHLKPSFKEDVEDVLSFSLKIPSLFAGFPMDSGEDVKEAVHSAELKDFLESMGILSDDIGSRGAAMGGFQPWGYPQ